MTRFEKLINRILNSRNDKNIDFNDMLNLLRKLGFIERINGDHYIFTKDGIEEIINLQPKGKTAKPYQVKQVRNLITKYKPGGDYE